MSRGESSATASRLVESPVFILSAMRSGSTLFRVLLNSHSMVCAPHEMHLHTINVNLSEFYTRLVIEESGLSQLELEHLLWDRLLHRTLMASGKPLIVEKTPNNSLHWRRIRQCWPEARYIFLLRHPASILESLLDFPRRAQERMHQVRDLTLQRAGNGAAAPLGPTGAGLPSVLPGAVAPPLVAGSPDEIVSRIRMTALGWITQTVLDRVQDDEQDAGALKWLQARHEELNGVDVTERNMQRILAQIAGVNEAMRELPGLAVRYEELADDPAGTTRQVCDFLGIPWEARMLDYGKQSHGAFNAFLGDSSEKIRTGTIQGKRPLPDAADIPAGLTSACRDWGYL